MNAVAEAQPRARISCLFSAPFGLFLGALAAHVDTWSLQTFMSLPTALQLCPGHVSVPRHGKVAWGLLMFLLLEIPSP